MVCEITKIRLSSLETGRIFRYEESLYVVCGWESKETYVRQIAHTIAPLNTQFVFKSDMICLDNTLLVEMI